MEVCVLGSVSTGDLNDVAGQSFVVNLALSNGTAEGLCNNMHNGIIILCCLSSHKGGMPTLDWYWSNPSEVSLDLTFDSTNLDVPQCADININDDSIVELTEDFGVSLAVVPNNASQQVTLNTSSATVFIFDNDGNH